DALRLLEDQPGDVPELVRELAALLDRTDGVAHVLGRGDLEEAGPRRVRAVRLDRLHRVDARPEALRHAAPVGRQYGRVDDHVRERDLPEQEDSREDHPVLPEPDDLARGRVDVAAVVALQLGRLPRPAERRERPEGGGEPRVEHVRVALELARPALGARVRGWPGARQMAVGTAPDRDLVPPPELARDAPVRRLLEGLDREAVLALRVEANAALAQRLEGRRGEPLHRAPPLRRDERLDPCAAPFERPP